MHLYTYINKCSFILLFTHFSEETAMPRYPMKNDNNQMQLQNMMHNMGGQQIPGASNMLRSSGFAGSSNMTTHSGMPGPSGMQSTSSMPCSSVLQGTPSMAGLQGSSTLIGASGIQNQQPGHPQIVELEGGIHDGRTTRKEIGSSSSSSGLNLSSGLTNQPASMGQSMNMNMMNGALPMQSMNQQLDQSVQMGMHQPLALQSHIPMGGNLQTPPCTPDPRLHASSNLMQTGQSFYDEHMRQFQMRQMNGYYANSVNMQHMPGIQQHMPMQPQMSMGHMQNQMNPMQQMPFMNNNMPQLSVQTQEPNTSEDKIVREVGYEDI